MTHDDFHNLTQAYLAGGLGEAERAAMEAHAAECPACAASLEQALAADRELHAAFAADVPDDRLEDRVIAALRNARPPHVIVHPMVRRAAVGVAAAIILGGVGFAVTRTADRSNVAQHQANTEIIVRRDLLQGVPSAAPTPATQPNANNLGDATSWGTWSEGRESKPASDSKHSTQWWDSDHDFAYKSPPTDLYDSAGKPSDPVSGDSSKVTPFYSLTGGLEGTAEAGKKLPEQLHQFAKTPAATNKPVDAGTVLNFDTTPLSSSSTATHEADFKKGTAKAGESPRFQPADAFGVVPNGTSGAHSSERLGRQLDISGTVAAAGTRVEELSKRVLEERQKQATSVNGSQLGDNGRVLTEQEKVGAGYLRLGVQAQPTARDRGTVVAQDGLSSAAGTSGQANGQKPADKPADGPAAGQGSARQPQQGQQQQQRLAKADFEKTEAPKPDESPLAGRKVIRNGEMTFEIDSYDSTVVQITKIAAEEGGFVATTESEKLPNGKVKGSVVVRVPPDRLDTLVLKLRGLGDLKNSRVSAQDITKQYTDLDAQLRAAKTMEQRLLEIIKSGRGEVKDLIEAEKQLGSWREKIEKLEGEIRYYNNLVALSTLTVTLAERDVRAASLLSETEQVQMGVEADDVEKARAAALKAIEEAKGRVIASDLKKHDAGQFAATITADIAPDQAGPVIDRLKQLGRVARLEAQRQQKTAEGTGTPIPGARVERKDTRLSLSIYNLANVAPRNTTTLQLAAEDVESAYRAILAQIDSAGGRVMNSQLTKPTPEQTSGAIAFESPAAAADVLLGAARGAGDVLRLDTATNPDTENTTAAKRGFNVTIQAAATVAPAESVSLRLAVDDVPAKFDKLLGALRGVTGARVTQSSVNQQTPTTTVGQIEVDVRGAEPRAAVERALADAGAVYLRSVTHTPPGQTMLADKAHVSVLLGDVNGIPPRETTTISVESTDVNAAAGQVEAAAIAAGGRKVDSDWSQQPGGQTVARIVVEVPQARAGELIKSATDSRRVLSIQREQTPNVPEGPFARSRISVSFSTTETIQGDQTLGGSVRSGLATSVQWLLRSVTWIVIGLCLVAPWAVVIWVIARIVKRRRRATPPESPTPPSAPNAAPAT